VRASSSSERACVHAWRQTAGAGRVQRIASYQFLHGQGKHAALLDFRQTDSPCLLPSVSTSIASSFPCSLIVIIEYISAHTRHACCLRCPRLTRPERRREREVALLDFVRSRGDKDRRCCVLNCMMRD